MAGSKINRIDTHISPCMHLKKRHFGGDSQMITRRFANDRGMMGSALSRIGPGRKVQGIASRCSQSGSEIKPRGAL
jgi:hypothetical protein